LPTKVTRKNAEELIKALSHPTRLAALQIFGARVASPNEVAEEIGEEVTAVSYHVKILRDYECIELVKTEPRRGATEHYYRATERGHFSDEEWRALSQEEREDVTALTGRELFVQYFAAQQAGTLDANLDRHLSWAPMTLDEEGFSELGQLLTATLEESFAIEAKSAARIAAGSEPGKPAVVGLLGFQASGHKR
jgi:DNA-binding transcriptional ArsR family regulator